MSALERVFLLNLVFMFGFLYVRTVKCPRRQLVFAILFVIWILFGLFVVKNSTFGLVVWSCTAVLAAHGVSSYQNFHRQKKILTALNPFLLRILLSLKVGGSLRDTIRAELLNEDKYFREVMSEVLLCVEKQQPFRHSLVQITHFYELFARLDREPAKIVTRIELFRRKIDCEMQFSAKVAQILSQPRAQAIVVGLLYAALVLFLQMNFKASEWRPYFYLSAPIFVIGQSVLLTMGRNYKWKL